MSILSALPQNIVLTTGNGQNYLTWSEVAGATNYIVQRSTTGLLGSFTTIASPAVNKYLDTTGSPGVQYWYQIASLIGSITSGFNSTGTNSLPLTITPCLPGQINLGYLRYMSKLRADKIKSNFLTDDEWNFNINQSSNRLYDFLITKFGDKYFLAPPVQITTNGIVITGGMGAIPIPNGQNYGAAPALYKLAGVDAGINASNNQWFTLPIFNWIDRNKYAVLQLAGTVQSIYGLAYCLNGNNIFIIPLPTTAQTLQLWYNPMLTQLLQDTDMMPFSISGWSELVIVDAAIKALIKEESYEQAAALVQERAGIIERIETTAANRDVGQPNVVSNSRYRAGDPNFGGTFTGFSGWGSGGQGFG